MRRPLIGITVDVSPDRYFVSRTYCRQVRAAGADSILLPPEPEIVDRSLDLCDGFILSGGDDPLMEAFGVPTHPRATPIDPQRQAFELALLARLDERRDVPVLGICLGMQLMALHAGGRMDQHLPETLPTADRHWGKVEHEITGDLGAGTVLSHHRQAITDPGSLQVAAVAPDDVIEAIRAPDRRFYLGVQWHPERTEDARLGSDLIRELVSEAGAGA